MAKRKHTHGGVKKSESSQESESKKSKTDVVLLPVVRSDDPVPRQKKWKNKQRVLVLSSRGIGYRSRHLMLDLRSLLPHAKPESKMDSKDKLFVINEMCEMKNCNKCIYFEAKKKMDLYMWVSNVPRGPSAKFLVENVHTMSELKMTGNCLKASRPLLSFSKEFEQDDHWKLLKELFVQVFSVPNHHPKSQPFFDHVFTFSIVDNRIWFRNYQILEEDASLAEIGPRFVLNPIRIFEGSFGGPTLYINPSYTSPNEHRRIIKKNIAAKYLIKVEAKKDYDARKPTNSSFDLDPTDDFFTITSEDVPRSET